MPGTPKKRGVRNAAAALQPDKDVPAWGDPERWEQRKGGASRTHPDWPRCARRNDDGLRCNFAADPSTDPHRCWNHAPPQVKVESRAARELRRWGLEGEYVDPGETLLRLVSQSARRCAELSEELGNLVDEEGLRKALIGEVRVPTESGSYVSGDYVRGMARLEAEERDRLAHFAKTAVQAGLATRQVELAEAQGRLMADVLRLVFAAPELGLTDAQMAVVPELLRAAQRKALEVKAAV